MKLREKDLMIDCIKSFLKVNKNRTNKITRVKRFRNLFNAIDQSIRRFGAKTKLKRVQSFAVS